MTAPGINRRTLAGAAVAGLGLPALAACSGGGSSSPGTGGSSSTPTRGAPATPSGSASGSGTSSPSARPALVDIADLPVGGGTVVAAQEVVVTQPESGRIMCFSAVCTHMGCIVSDVADGTINCGCHGSEFSIADGTVVRGPATTALPTVAITVRAGVVSLA